MKKTILQYTLILSTSIYFGYTNSYSQSREIININDSWKYTLSDDSTLFEADYDDSGWDDIHLPHTWNNIDDQEGENNYYRGIGWYRKSLFIGATQNRRVFLKFNAANLLSEVYINGEFIGKHIGGYSAFIFDVTDKVLQNSENIIAVKASNDKNLKYAPLSADFTFCGGITRSVELLITNEVLISPLDYASPGIYITPSINSDKNANINIKAVVSNYTNSNTTITEDYYIKNANSNVINSLSTSCILQSGSDTILSRNMNITNPALWQGLKNPYLYKLEVILKVNNIIVDELTQTFGIRYLGKVPGSLYASPDSGIYLNGNRYPLHGVAFHEDRVNKGKAISDQDRREDLDNLRETGLNYLRLSHYQHGQFTYDYCDSAGIIVWTEIPLIDVIDTSTSDFSENSKEQLRELIKQNYNHPSVCFWGLFNEIQSVENSPDATQLVTELNDIAKELDNTRFTVGASNQDISVNYVPDLFSLNLYYGWYYGTVTDFSIKTDEWHHNYSNSIIGISEYGAGASIKQHEENPGQPIHDSNYHPEEYQNYFHEEHWEAISQRPFIWESSIWVGFDFDSQKKNEGDTKGINDKGLITRDRSVKKDAYYFYKANWNAEPMIYITSKRFNQRNSSPVEVKVYSNIDSVRLEVNNVELQTIANDGVAKKWTSVHLKEGINKILAEGTINGSWIKDSCFWTYNSIPDTIFPGEIQINFQPGGIEPPEGYLADTGAVFNDRGNGYSYGWEWDNSDNARIRSTEDDLTYKTLNHLQKESTDQTWEIALENGTYKVSLVSGDPLYFDSYHSIKVENKNILQGQPTAGNPFISATDTVAVTDGRLTLAPDSNSANAKINFIHITKIELPPPFPPGEIQINFQPGGIEPPEGYLADTGAVFNDRGNGYSYGWEWDNSDNARIRSTEDDLTYKTLNHLQKESTDQTWEIALENGTYKVSLVSGDPLYFDSYHSLKVENKNILQGQPTEDNPFITGTDTIVVMDGKLTLAPDSNSFNAKINFIRISEINGEINSIQEINLLTDQVRTKNMNKNSDNQIFAYPIPFGDYLNIKGYKPESTIEIKNILGVTVYSTISNQSFLTIYTDFLQSGLYIINIINDSEIVAVLKTMHY